MPTHATSLNQLISAVKEEVCSNYRTYGRGLDGASLAARLRQRFGDIRYSDFGLERLADAISKAESLGEVRRDRTVAHLLVVPVDVPPGSENQEKVPKQANHYLRPEVWRAFVFAHQKVRLWLDRTSGRLTPEAQLNSTANAVEVQPISAERQREWMREFVQQQELPEEESPIMDDQYWIAFPAWLRTQGADYELAWRRFRTACVSDYVKEWSRTNDVRFASLLHVSGGRIGGRQDTSSDQEAIRGAILAAISEMSFEELQSVSIPVRCILRHFRAR